MSTPPHTAAPAQPTDPQRDRTTARVLRLLSLVRTLIAFGNQIADTLRARNAAEAPMDTAIRFGTKNIALILARITRGLNLAAALETKLADRVANPRPVRTATTPRSPRKPGIKTAAPQRDDSAAALANLPTAEEIADQLRRRPVHAVLIDICSDLGILAGDPMWHDLFRALIENGGSIVTFNKDVRKRTSLTNFFAPDQVRFTPDFWRRVTLELASAATPGTGPP